MIEKILKASEELAEKEEIIVEGYKELLEEINEELSRTPETEVREIKWEISGSGNAPREIEDYAVHAVMSVDIYSPEIFLQGSRSTNGKVESWTIHFPSSRIIQLFSCQLADMLKYFKEILERDHPNFKPVIIQLNKLLDRVRKNETVQKNNIICTKNEIVQKNDIICGDIPNPFMLEV
jgi:hypothetical protein